MPLGRDGLHLFGCARRSIWIYGRFLVDVDVVLYVGLKDLPQFRIEPGHTLIDAIAGVIGCLIPL
jgi:hypothetical protein